MQRIHSIQYDPLNVVARNADLVLQARVKDYSKLIDGFDKEMCIYNTKDFARFQFVRNEYEKHALPTLRIQSVGFLWNKSGGAWQGRFLSENELRSSTLQTLVEKNRIEEMQVEGQNQADKTLQQRTGNACGIRL